MCPALVQPAQPDDKAIVKEAAKLVGSKKQCVPQEGRIQGLT